MENLEWFSAFYNGIETNIEVTKCGMARRIEVKWKKKKRQIGIIDFNKIKKHTQGYIPICINVLNIGTKKILLHQLIGSTFLNYNIGNRKIVIDHIDNNKTNNNINNLQIITQRQNISKERNTKLGKHTGINFDKSRNKYRPIIQINGKIIYLGSYDCIDKASEAYQRKLLELTNPA